MKLFRLLAMLVLPLALLVAFVWPVYIAHEANDFPQKTSHPTRKHFVKLVPGMVMRLTLVRFTVPPGEFFTPPVLRKGAIPPVNMLKFYRDAAQAQNVTPVLHVFRPLLIRDGKKKGVSVGDNTDPNVILDKAIKSINHPPATSYNQTLDFTAVIRAGGFAAVKVEASDDNWQGDGRYPDLGIISIRDNARASVKLYPAHTIRLPKSFDNTLGKGILFVTLTPVAPVHARLVAPVQVPAKTSAPQQTASTFPVASPLVPGATTTVPTANSIVHVQITDFDIAAALVPSVTHAMMTPAHRSERLIAISLAADSQNHPFVITPGLNALDDPRKPHTFIPPIPSKLGPFAAWQTTIDVPESHYLLHQALHLASRVNPDGTAAADIILSEQPAKLPGDFLYPARLIGNSQTRAFVNINGSRTVLLSGPTGTGGVVHLIFATFTLPPPAKA